jgi:hypothetical protein
MFELVEHNTPKDIRYSIVVLLDNSVSLMTIPNIPVIIDIIQDICTHFDAIFIEYFNQDCLSICTNEGFLFYYPGTDELWKAK